VTTQQVKNAYAVLGLQKGAAADEIKQAYVTLVKKFDPEMHTDRFMSIQKAFDELKNPQSRAKIDVYTFNNIRGDFSFNADERSEAPDEQIEAALAEIEAKKTAGELAEDEARAKTAQGLMIRSWKRAQRKQWDEAIKDWQAILKLDPTHRRAKSNLLFSYIALGYRYANHNLYDEALEIWQQAAQMNPDNIQLIHNLALAAEMAGKDEEASRYWQETVKRWKLGLEREPENEYLKNCIIEVLRKHGEKAASENAPAPAAAPGAAPRPGAPHAPAPAAGAGHQAKAAKGIDEYREILRLNPNDFEAQYRIASMLMQEHTWPEAIKELEDLRKKHPRNIEVMNMLGWALLNSGKVDDAFMAWRKAKVIDPTNYQITESLIKAHMAMGRSLREKGLYTPCLVHFKALDRYQPNNDEVHYEIGKTYQMKGDERSAYIEYQKVLVINPKHKLARNGLSSLKLRR
jgi:tetratricopeptide (TPR) repeat protein